MILLNKIIILVLPLMPKFIVKIFSNKYVAGINYNQALLAVQNLNKDNQFTTIDILGEHTSNKEEAIKVTSEYIELSNMINIQKLKCNLSIKPSHIGSDINYDFVFNNFKQILKKASETNNFVRIDMESSKLTDLTIKLYNDLSGISNNVGIVFQAYLHRTEEDLNKLRKGSNIRLCKGIYKESEEIAFQKNKEINNNYLRLLKLALKKDIYVGIATHDKELIKASIKLINEMKINNNMFEFQYLYGVPMQDMIKIYHENNFKVRAYVPFGKEWYEYSIRRIKENPKIASYVIKNIFSKKN
tara:strand:+ start:869 stop:1771 length:903 start_codon:yes stop_codon:yes gene_type:complete